VECRWGGCREEKLIDKVVVWRKGEEGVLCQVVGDVGAVSISSSTIKRCYGGRRGLVLDVVTFPFKKKGEQGREREFERNGRLMCCPTFNPRCHFHHDPPGFLRLPIRRRWCVVPLSPLSQSPTLRCCGVPMSLQPPLKQTKASKLFVGLRYTLTIAELCCRAVVVGWVVLSCPPHTGTKTPN